MGKNYFWTSSRVAVERLPYCVLASESPLSKVYCTALTSAVHHYCTLLYITTVLCSTSLLYSTLHHYCTLLYITTVLYSISLLYSALHHYCTLLYITTVLCSTSLLYSAVHHYCTLLYITTVLCCTSLLYSTLHHYCTLLYITTVWVTPHQICQCIWEVATQIFKNSPPRKRVKRSRKAVCFSISPFIVCVVLARFPFPCFQLVLCVSLSQSHGCTYRSIPRSRGVMLYRLMTAFP